MEMMQHRANVSTVVIGGRPMKGPMQTVGGSRGARVYSATVLDNNIGLAGRIDAKTKSLLPNRSDTGMFITYASVNLRDQVRKNSNIPLQFSYEAAHCRIFWTFQTVNNYTNLWKQAARAIWFDHSLCVEGSRGFASKANDTTKAFPSQSSPAKPAATGNVTQSAFDIPEVAILPGQVPAPIPDSTGDLVVPIKRSVLPGIGPVCSIRKDGTDTCGGGTVCKYIVDGCTAKQSSQPSQPTKGYHCIPACNPSPNTFPCVDGDDYVKPCTPDKTIVKKGFVYKTGFCAPPAIPKGQPCAAPAGGGSDREDQGVNLAGGALTKRRRLDDFPLI
jgi:hypothetical protein